MNITQIARVGYEYYPNPTRIKKKNPKSFTSLRLFLSLYLSSVVSPYCHTLSSPHRHSLSLSLSLCLSSILTVTHTLSLRALQSLPLLIVTTASTLLVSCCGYLSLTFWDGSITSQTSSGTLSLSTHLSPICNQVM